MVTLSFFYLDLDFLFLHLVGIIQIALSREHANLRNDSEVPNVTEDFTLREKNITNSLAHEMTTDREGTEYEQSNRNVGDYYGGALWDIFRRQDLPNLQDYLQKNFREFQHVSQQGLQHVKICAKILHVSSICW